MKRLSLWAAALLLAALACAQEPPAPPAAPPSPPTPVAPPKPDPLSAPVRAVVEAAVAQVGVTLYYAPAYQSLPYPGGDLPSDRGVCTDVVIRAFRTVGVDLQREVHEDMAAHFAEYPKSWGLSRPDPNIDHRRCPNLVTFFRRKGALRPVGTTSGDYLPGDLVFWRLPSGVPHVGLVTDRPGPEGRPLVVHNIGAGAQLEDVLFAWPVTAHARFF